eukprot:CAMPEP_0174733374 /NCGR_PEP_ID=MMETSP1094-20130205/61169_1 /TAXON_ID=156173 /ORGANISM="Chrysochromulina brevifilum, Strain UTEX LB 985" /LENGTH=52 /DNA_ID=CAMNT_0015936021 /DNA_START=577 /DNA_END=735 /DNA_ORIENTATION=-
MRSSQSISSSESRLRTATPHVVRRPAGYVVRRLAEYDEPNEDVSGVMSSSSR